MGAHFFFAVARLKPRARVAMQLVVERLHLAPKAVNFAHELAGGHVVPAAPQLSHVGESERVSSLIRKGDPSRVRCTRCRTRVVPALPRFELHVVIAARRQRVLDLFNGPALGGVLRIARIARTRLSVGARHGRTHLRKLSSRRFVVGCRHRLSQAQELLHAREVRRQLERVEPARIPRSLKHVGRCRRFGVRGDRVGVVREIGLVRPRSAIPGHPKAAQVSVHFVEECTGIVERRSGLERRA